MKLLSLILIGSLLLASCTSSTRNMSANEARNSYEDAHATLKHGTTTFDDVRKKYGEPTEFKQLEDGGFACRWIERRTITKTPGYSSSSLSTFDEGSVTGRYHHTMTYISTLEATFNADKTLRNFFVLSDMK